MGTWKKNLTSCFCLVLACVQWVRAIEIDLKMFIVSRKVIRIVLTMRHVNFLKVKRPCFDNKRVEKIDHHDIAQVYC